jgi:hypothetical protein
VVGFLAVSSLVSYVQILKCIIGLGLKRPGKREKRPSQIIINILLSLIQMGMREEVQAFRWNMGQSNQEMPSQL